MRTVVALGCLVLILIWVGSAAVCQSEAPAAPAPSELETAEPTVASADVLASPPVCVEPGTALANESSAAVEPKAEPNESPGAEATPPPEGDENGGPESVSVTVGEERSASTASTARVRRSGTGGEPASEPSPLPEAGAETTGRPDKVGLLAGLEERSQAREQRDPGFVNTALSMALKLGLVLALAYLTILALKRFTDRQGARTGPDRSLKVVDSTRLSSTSSVHLLSVKGKFLLVGSSNGQVNVLAELDGNESAEAAEPGGAFAEYLEKYSQESRLGGASGRLAALMRDCAHYLKSRRVGSDGFAAGAAMGEADDEL